MATKIKRILSSVPQDSLFFSSWLAEQGIDRKEQTLYVRSGWLERIANGVYKLEGSSPSLFGIREKKHLPRPHRHPVNAN